MTLKVEKGSNSWEGIKSQNLTLIQIMGWPSQPENITFAGAELDYTYVATTKRLTLHCDIDMNSNSVILFS